MATTVYATPDVVRESLNFQDDSDGDAVERALNAASRSIDSMAGRRFYKDDVVSARTYRLAGRSLWTPDGWHQLLIDDVAETAGLVVEVGSTSGGWTVVADYDTAPENAAAHNRPITSLLHPTGWPCSYLEKVRVTAKWGWPAVPDEIVQACILQAGRLYRRKDSPEGVSAIGEWGPIRVARIDPDVQALVSHFVLPGFG